MMKVNTAQTSCQLFAKKGEAAPSGIAVRDPRGRPRPTTGASPLSFLIERRPDAASAPQVASAPQAEEIKKAFPVSDRNVEEYPVQPRLLVELEDAESGHGSESSEWKRLSFRLRPEEHRQLRNLARLWGVSVQSLLQKAVNGFVDSAVTPDNTDWRH